MRGWRVKPCMEAVRQRFSRWRVRRFDVNRFERLESAGRRKFRTDEPYRVRFIYVYYTRLRQTVKVAKSFACNHLIRMWYYNITHIYWCHDMFYIHISCIVTRIRRHFFFVENYGRHFFFCFITILPFQIQKSYLSFSIRNYFFFIYSILFHIIIVVDFWRFIA